MLRKIVCLHRRTDRQTDRVIPIYPPWTSFVGGIRKVLWKIACLHIRTDIQTDRQTDRQTEWFLYTPPELLESLLFNSNNFPKMLFFMKQAYVWDRDGKFFKIVLTGYKVNLPNNQTVSVSTATFFVQFIYNSRFLFFYTHFNGRISNFNKVYNTLFFFRKSLINLPVNRHALGSIPLKLWQWNLIAWSFQL